MSTKWNVFTSNFDLTGGGGGISTPVSEANGGTGTSTYTTGDILYSDAANSLAKLGIGSNGEVLTIAAGIPSWATASAGNTKKEYWFAAESLQPLETNFAPIEKLVGTNVNVFVRSFDDTTEEYVNAKCLVPSDVDTSGTVTFRAYVTAATAAASKNIGLTFGHLALNDSEDWDPTSPYTEEDSGAVAIDATQDDVTEVTWTETISNLGWAASDLVIFRVSRDTGVADNLTGDLYLFSLSIEIPRSA